ncbi:hypothetical protein [Acidovorax sp. NCPPB 3576]|uniref:hypothetical protein n=1 Tax=Acidovorax sp. NCPPB 3576 TaxID=2940488 RepID=UPI00234B4591|nr:hypothetical protein [Acidovorax sp. NCPPB 3576]WCM90552.1 hypothetical protein M5C98_11270 [Acidovorax sp. NCPPB 3576]
MANAYENNEGKWMVLSMASIAAIAGATGLDMATAIRVTGYTFVVTLLAGFVIHCFDTDSILGIGNTWPLFLGLMACAWFPAINHWAYGAVPDFVPRELFSVWWAEWYTKLGAFALLCLSGHAVNRLVRG